MSFRSRFESCPRSKEPLVFAGGLLFCATHCASHAGNFVSSEKFELINQRHFPPHLTHMELLTIRCPESRPSVFVAILIGFC